MTLHARPAALLLVMASGILGSFRTFATFATFATSATSATFGTFGTCVAFAAIALASCSGGPQGPAELDTKHDACSWCRMSVSDRRFAAQLVAPAEEPRFFDDLGCLASYLKEKKRPAGWTAFVADHRTKSWTPAAAATYTRVPGVMTPMSSNLIAHSDPASRDADPDSKGGTPVAAPEILGEAR